MSHTLRKLDFMRYAALKIHNYLWLKWPVNRDLLKQQKIKYLFILKENLETFYYCSFEARAHNMAPLVGETGNKG